MRQFRVKNDPLDSQIIRSDKSDLQHKRVGYLKVLYKNNKRTNLWSCVCDCGRHVTATTSQLISRKKTHCGCLKRKAVDPEVRAELEAKYNGQISPAFQRKKKRGFNYKWNKPKG